MKHHKPSKAERSEEGQGLTADSRSTAKRPYVAPGFTSHDLRRITLGGTSGSGDSGDTGSKEIPGSPGRDTKPSQQPPGG